MTRLCLAIIVLGCFFVSAVRAQDTGASDTGSSGGTGGEGSTITPGGAPQGGPPSTATPSTNPLTPAPPTTTPELSAGVRSGAVSAAQAESPSFTLPGGSGFSPLTLTAGEGRFAQPKYRFFLSLSQGYDDNVFSAPTNPIKQKDQVFTVFTAKQQKVPVITFIPGFGNVQTGTVTRTVFVPTAVTIPATPPAEKVGSPVTNARVSFQTQAASPRTVYTFDMSVGDLFYWSRPGGANDYNGSVSLSYLHKINPRTTLTAQADAVFTKQPDFSRINTPTRQSNSSYLSANSKIDLSFQLTPRISTVSSYTFNGTIYPQQNTGTGGDRYENGLSEELRYLYSPRTTLALDIRGTQTSHPQDVTQDSSDTFLLFGADYMASRRLRATIRMGEQIRAQQQGTGSSLSTPYFETTTAYVFVRGSTLNWTNRFGFEDSGSTTHKTLTYRTDLSLNYVLGAKLTANIGIAYNRNTTSLINGGNSQSDVVEQELQGNLGLNYVFSPALSLNANYTLTQLISTQPGTDYRRNQFFIGASYSF